MIINRSYELLRTSVLQCVWVISWIVVLDGLCWQGAAILVVVRLIKLVITLERYSILLGTIHYKRRYLTKFSTLVLKLEV